MTHVESPLAEPIPRVYVRVARVHEEPFPFCPNIHVALPLCTVCSGTKNGVA